eukprot:TRINITY_DN18689_c0_g1_i1.p1 TRINITY_DN18689_c0_g1~~TRINITY_DN18689_c0_g1_i1.p1  ORF type:complete len:373 (-),score=98.73 TRINITY_DN18689_c0_g1_i1:34-1032(-)
MAEQFFGPRHGLRGEEEEKDGRFSKTATKMLVTLSPPGEGNGDVGSLQRMLKDALKNGSKEKASKRSPQKTKEDEKDEKDEKAAVKTSESTGEIASPSRETSPGRSCASGQLQVVGGPCCADNPDAADTEEAMTMAETARVAHFVSQLANDLRQLLSLSHQAVAPPITSTADNKAADSAGAAGSPSKLLQASAQGFHPIAERGERLRRIVEGLAPARRGAAEQIMAAERELRCLDKDLRLRCQDLIGCDESRAQAVDTEAKADAEESELKNKIPMDEASQLQSLLGIHYAQQRSSLALAEFLKLPPKLKAVFDLTKKLSTEAEALCHGHGLS